MTFPAPSAVNNPGALAVPKGSTQDTQFNNSRLMADNPHIDGLVVYGANDLGVVSSSTLPVLTRVAKGQWAWNRTAAAAETQYYRCSPSDIGMRIGELFSFNETNKGSANPTPGSNYPPGSINAPSYQGAPATGAQAGGLPFPKGIMVVDIFASYVVGVVALTTATLRLGYTQYQNNVAINQVDVVPAAGIATATQTNPYNQVITLASQSVVPIWCNADLTEWEIEANIVLANTGTISFINMGFHYYFNWT